MQRPTVTFRALARALPVAYAVHVAEEAPEFTAWARRNASGRYSQRDFVRNNALGFISTVAATAVVRQRPRPTLDLAYYTLVVTQQALFNAVFHSVATVAFREYSPGLATSLLTVPIWAGLTRAAMAESRLTSRQVVVCTLLAGAFHAGVVANQVFYVGVPERT
jgi:Protein of unknown function with HXXEE motif